MYAGVALYYNKYHVPTVPCYPHFSDKCYHAGGIQKVRLGGTPEARKGIECLM